MMKTKHTLALAAVLGLLSSAAYAQQQNDDQSQPQRPDRAQFEERHKQILEKYDVNHDGKIDESEHDAIRKDIESGKLEAPPGPPPGGQGRHGQGRPPRPNPEMLKKILLEKYDTNKNGRLDDDEYIQLGKDVESGKFPPLPPPGDGQRGPRPGGMQNGQGGPDGNQNRPHRPFRPNGDGQGGQQDGQPTQ